MSKVELLQYKDCEVGIRNTDAFGKYGCQEFLPKGFQLIILDTPYTLTKNEWDKSFSLEKLWELVLPLLKDDGVIVFFTKQPFTTEVINSNREMFRYELIWEKEKGTQFFEAKNRPLPSHENILIFSKKYPTKYSPQMRKDTTLKSYIKKRSASNQSNNYCADSKKQIITVSNGDRYPLSILKYPRDHANQGIHSTQKPVGIITFFIKSFTSPGDTILDPMFGSCSTGIACLKTNRNFIGMELNTEYFQKGLDRLKRFIKYHVDEFWNLTQPIPIENSLEKFMEGC